MNHGKKILLILILGLILRLSMLLTMNLHSENYWEYGEIAKNLISGRGYSLFYIHDNAISINFSEKFIAQSSAYMPPLYVYFLCPFMLIKHLILRNILLIITQSLLSTYVIWLVYKYTRQNFSRQAAEIATVLCAILPGFIYSVKSFTPVILFQICILFLLLLRNSEAKNNEVRYGILRGVVFTALIYCRSEMALLALVVFLYQIIKRRATAAMAMSIVIVVLMMPWMVRNYSVFGKCIPLTTNGGFNFYRGNNNIGIGDWGTDAINEKILQKSRTVPFEIAQNDVYWNEGNEFIRANPQQAITNDLQKIWDLWFFSLKENRAAYFWQIFVSVFLCLTFFVGIFSISGKSRYKIEYGYFITSTIVSALFFALPRYQTMLHTVMVPFCANGVVWIYSKYKTR